MSFRTNSYYCLGDALVTYFQVGEELKSRPAPELDCELPPHTHLIRALERMGVRDPAIVRDVAESQRVVTLQAARPAEGAVSLLKHLRDNGCSLGLVSNFADGDEGRDLLSDLKLTRYFNAVVFSGDVGWRKPDRRVFETALSALDAEAREVLHIVTSCGPTFGVPVNAVWLPYGSTQTDSHSKVTALLGGRSMGSRHSALVMLSFSVRKEIHSEV